MTSLCFWPPFCFIKLTTCCWPDRSNAFINLMHCSSDVSSSSKASFLSYTVLSLRTLAHSLRLNTSSLSSSSRSPKSGSTKSASRHFSVDKIWVSSSARITASTRSYLQSRTTVQSKRKHKQNLLSTTSFNTDRFAEFVHRQTQQLICNKVTFRRCNIIFFCDFCSFRCVTCR